MSLKVPMALQAPDASATRARGADWLELSAIAAGRIGYSHAALLDALEIEEDDPAEKFEDAGDVLEDEILQLKHEPFVDDVLSEIEWRVEVLGESYPFQLERTHSAWRLIYQEPVEASARLAGVVYTTCLLITGLRYGLLDDRLNTLFVDTAADVFQIVASLVARGALGGSKTFWMGHPRPEHDGYGAALERFVEDVGVGKVKDPYPPSQRGRNKDGGVDVIAWRSFKDRRPTPLVIYGQAASGKKWKDKSVEDTLDSHFHHWMTDRPVKYYLPAMYIPFVQHEDVSARSGSDFDTVAHDSSIMLEKRLGLVVDRLRLTELTPASIPLASADDRERFLRAVGWTLRFVRDFRSAELPEVEAA